MIFAYIKRRLLQHKMKNLEVVSQADCTFPVAYIPAFILLWAPGLFFFLVVGASYRLIRVTDNILKNLNDLPKKLVLRGIASNALEQHEKKLRWNNRYGIDPATVDFDVYVYVEPCRELPPESLPEHVQWFSVQTLLWSGGSSRDVRENYNRLALLRWEKSPRPKTSVLEES